MDSISATLFVSKRETMKLTNRAHIILYGNKSRTYVSTHIASYPSLNFQRNPTIIYEWPIMAIVTDRTTVGTPPKQIARPTDVLCNNCVSPSVCLSVCLSVRLYVRPLPVSEKTHNSCTTRYILITFCMSTLSNAWHV